MTVSLLNWGVHVWRPSHILRPTPTTVEPLRVSPPEAVAYQFELTRTGAKREGNEPTRGGRASLSADKWGTIRRTETITWMPHLSRRSRKGTCAAPVKPHYVANPLQMAG